MFDGNGTSAFSRSQIVTKQDKTHDSPFSHFTFKNCGTGTIFEGRQLPVSPFLRFGWSENLSPKTPNIYGCISWKTLLKFHDLGVPLFLETPISHQHCFGPVFSSSMSCSRFLSREKFFEMLSWEKRTLLSLALKLRSKC